MPPKKKKLLKHLVKKWHWMLMTKMMIAVFVLVGTSIRFSLLDNILQVFAGSLTSASISLSSTVASATSVTATISFTSATSMQSSDIIKVTFADAFDLGSVGSSSGACSSPGGLTFTSAKGVGNFINMTRNDGGAGVNSGTAFTCTIANITNPSATGQTTSYTIEAKDSTGAIYSDTASVAGTTITSAAPTLSTKKYLDSDGNGTVDKIRLTFSATIATCTATVADFALVANDITGAALSGGSVSCAGNDAIVDITLGTAGNANITSHTTAPTIAYTDHASREISNAGAAQVASFTAVNLADGAGPVVTALTIKDATSNDGKIDRIDLTYSEALADTAAAANGFDVTSASNHGSCTGESADPDGTTTLVLTFSCANVYTAVGDINAVFSTNSGVKDAANNQAPTKTFTSASSPAITDSAKPLLTAIALSSAFNRNRITFTYSEAITVTNGASTNAKGDITTNGLVAGFGSFATAGNVTVPTTKNTVGGNGTTIITIDLADQAGGYMNSASTTEPSGVFTPTGSAQVVDAAANQVNTNNTPTASGGASWDLTKPTISSVTISDSAGSNGKVDRAVVVFDSAIRDANITNGDGTLGGGAGTFSTGTANDATTTFNLTADTLATNTAANAAQFNYSAATTKITDLAGNLVSTATPGQIADADIVETDGASPILTAIALSSSSNRNRLTLTYSEAVTITNGASTSSKGDVTTAGTVAGFGSFATAGNTTIPTTKNTVAGNGTTTITIDLADQAAGYMNSASTTEPSGVFTPVASAQVVDAVSLQVNTSGTPTATGGGTWDLTKPTISSVTISDSAGSNGKVDRAVIVFNSAVRDSNITNGDGTLGGGAGTFSTGSADDATTTFNLTADTLATDTSATAAQFDYSAATTKIIDLAGNLLNTATPGQIVDGDIVETDGAKPVITTFTYKDNDGNGKIDQILVSFSETVTAASVLKAQDLTFTNAGDFTNAAFGSATTDLITSSVNSVTVTLGTESSVIDTAEGTGGIAITSQNSFSITDGTNTNSTLGAQSQATYIDGAKPVIKSFTYIDNNLNGKIDQMTLAFSETVLAASVLRPADLTLTNAGDFTGLAFGSGATDAITSSVSSVTITLGTEATVIDTAENSGNIAVSSQNNFSLTDGTNTNSTLGAQSQASFSDGAKPVIKSFTYLDNDGNGKMDQMTVTFSETVVAASVLRPADLTFSNVGDFTSAAFGSGTTDAIGSSVTSVTIALGTESTVVDTIENSGNIAISSQNNFSLTDGTNTNSTLGAQTQVSFLDGMGPVVTTIGISDTNADNKADTATLAYSEALADTAAGANGFDVTSASNHGSCTGESADPAASTTLTLSYSCSVAYFSTGVGDMNIAFTANSGIKDASNNQSPSKTFTLASSPAITTTGVLSSTNVQPASLVQSVSGNVTVTFTTVNAIPITGKIKITFPAGFNVAGTSGGTCSSMDGSFATAVSGQVVTITRSAGSSQSPAAESCTLSNISNPSSTGSTGTYVIQTTNSSDDIIDQDSAVAADTILPSVGTLSGTNVEPASLVAGATSTTTISFTTVNAIPATGKIKVTFGAGFILTSVVSTNGTCSTMDGSFATTVSGQVVTITRSAGSSQSAAAENCTIGNIINPQVSGSTGTYIIRTTDSADSAVDENTTVTADTITAGSLSSASVTPTSLAAEDTSFVTIRFTTANPIPTTGKIIVIFPAGFSLSSNGTTNLSTGGSYHGTNYAMTLSGLTLTMTGNAAGTGVGAAEEVNITVSNVKNPATTGATGGFSIATKTTGDVTIDSNTTVSGVTILNSGSQTSFSGGGSGGSSSTSSSNATHAAPTVSPTPTTSTTTSQQTAQIAVSTVKEPSLKEESVIRKTPEKTATPSLDVADVTNDGTSFEETLLALKEIYADRLAQATTKEKRAINREYRQLVVKLRKSEESPSDTTDLTPTAQEPIEHPLPAAPVKEEKLIISEEKPVIPVAEIPSIIEIRSISDRDSIQTLTTTQEVKKVIQDLVTKVAEIVAEIKDRIQNTVDAEEKKDLVRELAATRREARKQKIILSEKRAKIMLRGNK